VHLVGFIIRIYHDARSPERQICHDARSPERQIYHDARSTERQMQNKTLQLFQLYFLYQIRLCSSTFT